MHLLEDHPAATALEGQDAISFEVLRTFEKPLERQVAEAVAIQNCKADLVLNRSDQDEKRGGVGRGRRQRGAQQ